MINNKGQGMFNYFFNLGLFILLWIFFLGKLISDYGQEAIINNNMVGLEAFLYGNINLLLLFVVVIVTIMVVKFN